jgi:hypothetical protein
MNTKLLAALYIVANAAAVKRACRALGIKHTYKALREYLTEA